MVLENLNMLVQKNENRPNVIHIQSSTWIKKKNLKIRLKYVRLLEINSDEIDLGKVFFFFFYYALKVFQRKQVVSLLQDFSAGKEIP